MKNKAKDEAIPSYAVKATKVAELSCVVGRYFCRRAIVGDKSHFLCYLCLASLMRFQARNKGVTERCIMVPGQC